MSYTVLARKYRPKTFQDVVGQEWISRTLTNAIREGRVAHAFLFAGPRGVGKTSMARILSKALNCHKGPTPEPCLTCDHCTGIAQGNDVDVLEIDAASNRGIDHIRALRENVRYVPANSRNKIYIIDEIHMLTMESFNALLKTLEEPPAHVKFIFATTEPQKMPETVRSRCQCFDFRRISHTDITRRLESIAQRESIDCEAGVLQRMAVLSKGGMRDAESLLDQVASLGKGRVLFEGLNSLTGRLSPHEVGDLVDAIQEEDTPAILDFVDRVFSTGTQAEDLLKDLIDYWRALMMAAAGRGRDVDRVLPGLEERCIAQAEKTDLDGILACLQIAVETLRKGRWFDDQRVLIEIALLKMTRLSSTLDLSEALERLGTGKEPGTGPTKKGAAKSKGRSLTGPGSEPPPPLVSDRPVPGKGSGRKKDDTPTEGSVPGAPKNPPLPSDPNTAFGMILQALEKDSKILASYFKQLKVCALDGDAFQLEDTQGGESRLFNTESPETRQKLNQASREVFGRPLQFHVKKQPPSGPEEIPPMVKRTMDLFDGKLM
jgi:DNA polymerase-3 subunit gamma/tau